MCAPPQTQRLWHWLAAFLDLDPATRKQAVGVDGRLPATSGVPQGTVLGPCLFLIHPMGISTNLSGETIATSFADDTRLVQGIHTEEDSIALQDNLNKV